MSGCYFPTKVSAIHRRMKSLNIKYKKAEWEIKFQISTDSMTLKTDF